MNWKTKSCIQNAIAKMPKGVSDKLYYFIQRKFGDLKTINPIERLSAGITIYNLIKKQNKIFEGKAFFELGTGRRLNLPISLWLLNSGKIFTVDLNNYLKRKLIQEDLDFIVQNKNEITTLFANTSFDDNRLKELILLANSGWQMQDLLNLCNIEYMPYCDARRLDLNQSLVDYYVSYTVLEHIPQQELVEIFEAAKRALSQEGLMIHFVDYRDHFWYSDTTISPLNFLTYDDISWGRYSNNKFMYMNRLRHDDYITLFEKLYLEIINTQACSENISIEHTLDHQFRSKSKDVLQILDSWFVLSPRHNFLNDISNIG